MSARPIEERWSNGLARTCHRCAANARLWAWRARGSTAPKPVAEADDLAVMRRIRDELHLELPFYGSRRMTASNSTRKAVGSTASGCGG